MCLPVGRLASGRPSCEEPPSAERTAGDEGGPERIALWCPWPSRPNLTGSGAATCPNVSRSGADIGGCPNESRSGATPNFPKISYGVCPSLMGPGANPICNCALSAVELVPAPVHTLGGCPNGSPLRCNPKSYLQLCLPVGRLASGRLSCEEPPSAERAAGDEGGPERIPAPVSLPSTCPNGSPLRCKPTLYARTDPRSGAYIGGRPNGSPLRCVHWGLPEQIPAPVQPQFR